MLYGFDENKSKVTMTPSNIIAGSLYHKELDGTTLDTTSGSFAFSGSGTPWSGNDWVGLQIGDSVDKFQIVAKDGTLHVRQNDNGGASGTGWTLWNVLYGTNNKPSKSDVGLGNVANYNQSKAIKGITRSGTTFTYTCLDGTTGTFTQKDDNTTYSAGSNITLTGTVFSLTKANVVGALGYTPPTTNTTYSDATTSAHGLMTAADKTKLNGITTGATKTRVKGNSESSYRTGDVNLTAANIGAAASNHSHAGLIAVGSASYSNFAITDGQVITRTDLTPPARSGYTPVAIGGFHMSGTGSGYAIITKCAIENGKIYISVRNPTDNVYTWTLNMTIIYIKNS